MSELTQGNLFIQQAIHILSIRTQRDKTGSTIHSFMLNLIISKDNFYLPNEIRKKSCNELQIVYTMCVIAMNYIQLSKQ